MCSWDYAYVHIDGLFSGAECAYVLNNHPMAASSMVLSIGVLRLVAVLQLVVSVFFATLEISISFEHCGAVDTIDSRAGVIVASCHK